jgi:hypothetical protein
LRILGHAVQFINACVRGIAPQVPGLILSKLSAYFVRVNDRYIRFAFLSIVSIELKQLVDSSEDSFLKLLH